MSTTRFQDIQYLAFSGAGVLGPFAYGGAFFQLLNEKEFAWENIKGAFGASSGAKCALAACLYTTDDMKKYLEILDTSHLAGKRSLVWSLYHFVYRFGWRDNAYVRKGIEDIIEFKTNKKDITFGEIKKNYGKDLYIITAVLYKIEGRLCVHPFVFSPYNAADTKVMPVVLASTAIPGYFPYVRLKKISEGRYEPVKSGGDVYFDPAGFASAEPVLMAKQTLPQCPAGSILGFRIQSEKKPLPSLTKNISNYQPQLIFLAVLKKLLSDYRNASFELTQEYKSTICVDPQRISFVNFHITAEEKKKVYVSGARAANRFFKKTESDINLPELTFTQPAPPSFNYSNLLVMLISLAVFANQSKRAGWQAGLWSAAGTYLISDFAVDQVIRYRR